MKKMFKGLMGVGVLTTVLGITAYSLPIQPPVTPESIEVAFPIQPPVAPENA